ncbi:hypothetical protein CVIRNUC_000245 [Coccomyxa viridis]|uniref:Ketoreductase domain-containing protein n=1 Tax=Coccomyxa viridis TaxID=1274662 RepID=A0AAV1HQU8_9CHLO|nr:hypothetical protein CVIRNUC_000245 [Coccomyxa viridis]
MPTRIANIDRVVVVTGVSSGIGYGITKYLINQGCHVFGSVRKEEDAKRLQAECGESFSVLKFDVTDEEAVQKAAAMVAICMNGHCLLALVNNAGIHVGLDALADQPVEKLRKQLEVNLVAQLIVTKAFLPQLGLDLTLMGKPGKIVNMSSVSGSYTLPFSSAYSASKAGLNALSEGMRRELKPFGIGVVIIAPGPIRTKIWDDLIRNAEPTADSGSLFAEHVQVAHALSVTEASKRSWFWEPEVIGKQVWKVLNRRFPPTHVVVTPTFWLTWFGPTFFPGRLVDIEISRRFKLGRRHKRGAAPASVKEAACIGHTEGKLRP